MTRHERAAAWIAAAGLLAAAGGAHAGGADLGAMEAAVQSAAEESGTRDTIVPRVLSGEACVDASLDRARDIRERFEQLQEQGKLGDYTVVVGARSGYNIPFVGSVHTYTVVEVRDPYGRLVRTWGVDNYLSPRTGSASVWEHEPIDWTRGDTEPAGTVKGPRRRPPTAAPRTPRPADSKPAGGRR